MEVGRLLSESQSRILIGTLSTRTGYQNLKKPFANRDHAITLSLVLWQIKQGKMVLHLCTICNVFIVCYCGG